MVLRLGLLLFRSLVNIIRGRVMVGFIVVVVRQ
jgi:hypothetical protein